MNKKNINALHIFDNYLPITENWAYRLLENTPNTKISIFAKQYLLTDYYTPEFKYIDHLDNYLLEADMKLGKSSFYEVFLKIGIKILRKLSPGNEKALRNHLDKYGYDIVHAHFANIGWDFFKTVRNKNLPYIISLYGWDYEKLPFIQPAYQEYFQVMFKECAAIVCEGPHGANTLIAQGCPKDKISIIHLGLECDKIPFIRRNKRAGDLNLIQIAAFSPTKGYLEAIKAFDLALKSCPNMTYTIVGVERISGYKEKIQDLVKKLDLTERVKIRSKINYKELHFFLSDFHVFIHPSQYTPEKDCEGGAPIILLDAQCTGLPILSTFHCDIPNEVEHEKTGLLSEEGNIEQLAMHIVQFYQMEQEEYDKMGRLARLKMEKEFDIKISGEQLASLYRKVSR